MTVAGQFKVAHDDCLDTIGDIRKTVGAVNRAYGERDSDAAILLRAAERILAVAERKLKKEVDHYMEMRISGAEQ